MNSEQVAGKFVDHPQMAHESLKSSPVDYSRDDPSNIDQPSTRLEPRNALSLDWPPESLIDFPGIIASRPRFRAYKTGYSPWWFSSARIPGKGGRFDLVSPNGTCYVAETIEVAVRERLGLPGAGNREIPDDPVLRDTKVSKIYPADWPTQSRMLADMLHPNATGVVTREIFGDVSYALTQAWAARLSRDGFNGVSYEPRFTMGRVTAEAWFGPVGAHAIKHKPVDYWRRSIPVRTSKLDANKIEIID